MALPSLQWLAGFFDGEGSVGVYRNGQGHGGTLRVQITQNCSPLVDILFAELRERWGGSVSLMNKNRTRPAWIWQVSAAKGAEFLREIEPYLVFKQEQARVALAWWDSKPTRTRNAQGHFNPMTEEERNLAREVEDLLKRLKKE